MDYLLRYVRPASAALSSLSGRWGRADCQQVAATHDLGAGPYSMKGGKGENLNYVFASRAFPRPISPASPFMELRRTIRLFW
jgi:hypothetical protein